MHPAGIKSITLVYRYIYIDTFKFHNCNNFNFEIRSKVKSSNSIQGPKTPTSNIPNQQPSRTGTPTQNRADSHPVAAREENSQSSCSYGRTTSNCSSVKSREPSGPQDELLEIINDFKNNVFTITEVERLVENWRNRNDVQQSFKDKQRQLTAMREEYERIQKRMKEEMKAPTPFDRIRKFFSKGKKGLFDIVMILSFITSLILVLYFYFVILFRFKRFFEWK